MKVPSYLARLLAALLVLLLGLNAAQAALPERLDYQGFLTDSAGVPLDGAANITFSLYNASSGGVPLWSEFHSVGASHGVFSVVLGASTPFPINLFDTPLWLGIEVNGDGEMVPRKPLTAVGFAFRAQQAENDADTLANLGCAATQVAKYDGSAWVCATDTTGSSDWNTLLNIPAGFADGIDDDSGGDITAVMTGIGLSGGAASGDAQLYVAFAGSGTAPTVAHSDHNHDAVYYTQAQVNALLASLQSQIDALQADNTALQDKLQYVTVNGTDMYVTGANLYVQSGSGTTDGAVNGLGNLIVGYDEYSVRGGEHTGSHNLVVGSRHSYTGYGGIVAGEDNSISGNYSSVLGGEQNNSSGNHATVGGGRWNVASGLYASIAGGGGMVSGEGNVASADYAAILGGRTNLASGQFSTITGGQENRTTAIYASVTGGRNNAAEGRHSVVVGGGGATAQDGNTAWAEYSSVLGGTANTTGDTSDAGHLTGLASSIGGGTGNTASGPAAHVAGGSDNTAWSENSAVLGGSGNTAGDASDPTHAIGSAATVTGGSGVVVATPASDALDLIALQDKLQYVTVNGTEMRITGANLHIESGGGATNGAVNGLGNLIVGYDEARDPTNNAPSCSLGHFSDETSCTSGGGVWAVNHKSGSHNIVVGAMNNYSRYGGLVAGNFNTIAGIYASVSGGLGNTANRDNASVSGGAGNVANSYYSSVSGGFDNVADNYYASVSGGSNNTARGASSSVLGGGGLNAIDGNIAFADYSAIVGGLNNLAGDGSCSYSATENRYICTGGTDHTVGQQSTVTGGFVNLASGQTSSVGSGMRNTASAESASVSGGEYNTASAKAASVSGGEYNTASGNEAASVSGGEYNIASGAASSVNGGLYNEASGFGASASGGQNNQARGTASSVTGGGSTTPAYGNKAYGNYSAILGGIANTTGLQSDLTGNSGIRATIAGGDTNTATGDKSTVSGGKNNTASALESTVSGGKANTASGTSSTVSGGESRSATSQSDWAAGSLYENY